MMAVRKRILNSLRRRMRRDRLDESGQVLIIALIFITIFAIVMAAILGFSNAGLRETVTARSVRNTQNALDGATDGAINSIRGSLRLGTEGTGGQCGPFKPQTSPPQFSSPPDEPINVQVDCEPQPGSGFADDQPPYAIMTIGSGSNEGFIQKGNSPLTVDGGIYSNGVLDLTPGGAQATLQTYGDLLAEGNCTPVAVMSATGTMRCNYPGDSSGDDPNYPPGVATPPLTLNPAASCGGSGSSTKIVAFSPGTYTDVPSAPSNCSGSVWWFQPGVYYFRFLDSNPTWHPDSLPGKTVIGGTLKPPLDSTSDASAVSVPGACDKDAPGVQFIFGGPSRLLVQSQGSVELCGGENATNFQRQRIAFYGAQTGTTPSTTLKPVTATSPASAGYQGFTPKHNALVVDNTFATSTLNAPAAKNADIRLSEFADLPARSVISQVLVRITHEESDVSVKPELKVTMPSGSKTYKNTDLPTCVSKCTKTIDITSEVKIGVVDVNAIEMTYTASINSGGPFTGKLDGIEVHVDLVGGTFEAHRCPVGESTCDIIESTVDQNIFFHGTVYAPTAAMDLWVHNKKTTIFGRGVIARTLVANVSASSKQHDSPFQLPGRTTKRVAVFTAKALEEDGSAGRARLRAKVEYTDVVRDGSGTVSAYPGYAVRVISWSVLR